MDIIKSNNLVQGSESQHLRAKQKRKELDNYRCSLCGRTAEEIGKPLITAHHLVKKELGGAPDPDNMITLCIYCHADLHAPGSRFEHHTN